MHYTIKFIGGPRAGQSLQSSTAPRAFGRTTAEVLAGVAPGHYLKIEVDEDLKVVVYKWQVVSRG